MQRWRTSTLKRTSEEDALASQADDRDNTARAAREAKDSQEDDDVRGKGGRPRKEVLPADAIRAVLNRHRAALNINWRSLALRSAISHAALVSFLNGHRALAPQAVTAIARTCGLTAEELLMEIALEAVRLGRTEAQRDYPTTVLAGADRLEHLLAELHELREGDGYVSIGDITPPELVYPELREGVTAALKAGAACAYAFPDLRVLYEAADAPAWFHVATGNGMISDVRTQLRAWRRVLTDAPHGDEQALTRHRTITLFPLSDPLDLHVVPFGSRIVLFHSGQAALKRHGWHEVPIHAHGDPPSRVLIPLAEHMCDELAWWLGALAHRYDT